MRLVLARLDLVLPCGEVIADHLQLELLHRRRPELLLPSDEVVLQVRVVVAKACKGNSVIQFHVLTLWETRGVIL